MDLKNKGYLRNLLLVVAFGVVLNFGLQHFSDVTSWFGKLFKLFSPFVLGAAIAFILNVPMRAIENGLFGREWSKKKPGKKGRRGSSPDEIRLKIKRPVSYILALLAVLAVIFIVIFMIVPELSNTFKIIGAALPGFYADVQALVTAIAADYPEIGEYLMELQVDWKGLVESAVGFIRDSEIFSTAFGAVSSLFSGIFDLFVGFFFSIYLLMQKETLALQCRKLLYAWLKEPTVEYIVRVGALSSTTFSRFLSGQCLEAMILGTMFFIVLTVLQYPYALLIGVLVAVTALIPIFGAFIGCGVGAFLILIVDPLKAFWFIVIFLILQQIEGNLIYPKVVGNSVGLPSIWVLVAVSLGGSLMGVAGMLIFIPLCSVIYALLRELVYDRLQKKNITVR